MLISKECKTEMYLLNVVIEAIVVLLGASLKILDGFGDLFELIAVICGTGLRIAHAHGDSLHGLTQVLLIFFDVREVGVIL